MSKKSELTRPEAPNTPPLIASFGFCFSNKGLPELVKAVGLLKQAGTPVRLLMLNAEYPSGNDSAEEVVRIRNTIEKLGLQADVELRTDFIEDDVCLALLGKADLVVNSYQRTGESASGSVRYGLSAGRPVAVTPLPLFDDLGDAVFRLPGTTPREMAWGIAGALRDLEENSEAAKRVQGAARRLLESHDYTRQAIGLMRTIHALVRPQKVLRGVFVNSARENCSIHESGRMIYSCIKEFNGYSLDYFSLDMLNIPPLTAEGRIRVLDKSQTGGLDEVGGYDFWVINWHFLTLPLELESIRRLPGVKFAIVLEADPGNPLKMIHRDVFDGYIVLDPTTPAEGKIFPFPRPLEGDPQRSNFSRDVPVIGSFGYGTPGKGFELLVEAVNREFEEAVVRINVPIGAHTSSADVIHGQTYHEYIASLCKSIAKPGVEVRFTHEFMSPDELVHWCGENDLNCFMYTRRQPGLSATTDQAIMSGRPMLTSSNDAFRHIHHYIPPYPVIGLRQAIETSAPLVRRMQRDWSRASFGETFRRMLASFGLIAPGADGGVSAIPDERPATVMVASQSRSNPDDICWYSTRMADCLGRTGKYNILRVRCSDLRELEEQVAKHRPSAVILADFPGVGREAVAAALKTVAGPKVLLADDLQQSVRTDDGLLVLRRQPVIPYFTSATKLRTGAHGIWLIGFAARDSNLEEVVAKIGRELPEAEFFLEVTDSERAEFSKRVSALREHLFLDRGEPLPILCLAVGGENLIANFTVSHLAVFYNDPERTEELESVISLALTTERTVAFTRASPFPCFLGGGTYVEDHSIADIIAMGMGAQIELCHDFGEGQFYAKIHRLLSEELAEVVVN